MRNVLAHYTEISGFETSRFILGQGEKRALVFTAFHSLCSSSAWSSVFYSCHLPPYISSFKSSLHLVFLSVALGFFPAPFLLFSFSSGYCFLTMLLEYEELKDSKGWRGGRQCWWGKYYNKKLCPLAGLLCLDKVLWRCNLQPCLTSALRKLK